MVKLGSIGFLMLMFMIPTSMIKSLIHEREMRSNDVVNEVSSKWGISPNHYGAHAHHSL